MNKDEKSVKVGSIEVEYQNKWVGWRKYSAYILGLTAIVLPAVFAYKHLEKDVYEIMVSGAWKMTAVYILGNGVSALANVFKK